MNKQLHITDSGSLVEDYLEHSAADGRRKIRLYKFTQWLLTKTTGLRFNAVLPEPIAPYSPEGWRYVKIMHKLVQQHKAKGPFLIPRHLRPDEPPLHHIIVESADTTHPDHKVSTGSGVDFTSPEIALVKAFGEYAERESVLKFKPEVTKRYNLEELTKAGICPPLSITGLSKSTRSALGERFELNPTDRFACTKVQNIINKQSVWLPSQLFSFNPPADEKVIRPVISTGAATHPKLETAIRSGIYELIERDAFMLTWYKRVSVPKIDPNTITYGKLLPVFEKLSRYNLTPHIYDLTHDFNLPTILVIITDDSGQMPTVSFGASTHHSAETALEKALIESMSTRYFSRDTAAEDRLTVTKTEEVIDQATRQQYWFNPAKIHALDFLLKQTPSTWINTAASHNSRSELSLDDLIMQFKNKSYSLFAANVRHQQFDFTNMHIQMVLAPELQPLHLNENYAYLNGDRFDKIADIFPNYTIGIKKSDVYNPEPHPFP